MPNEINDLHFRESQVTVKATLKFLCQIMFAFLVLRTILHEESIILKYLLGLTIGFAMTNDEIRIVSSLTIVSVVFVHGSLILLSPMYPQNETEFIVALVGLFHGALC